MTDDRAAAEQPGRLGRRAFLGSAALGAATLAAAGCTAGAGPGSPGPGRLARTLRDLTDEARGAPWAWTASTTTPATATTPAGLRIPLDAHIRMANPRTPEAADNRILRRGFNFSRGFDAAGRLDQGLKGESLEEYVRPVGGGFFFVLPGVTAGDGRLGQQLLA